MRPKAEPHLPRGHAWQRPVERGREAAVAIVTIDDAGPIEASFSFVVVFGGRRVETVTVTVELSRASGRRLDHTDNGDDRQGRDRRLRRVDGLTSSGRLTFSRWRHL